ncbi:hypothetical protein DRZ77_03130 [Candidatus Woesearchaeota archaeon]|nr:MAG: hypothetical protein DRZ77_03130 [Candidatus Woesearchaeota archaeon]
MGILKTSELMILRQVFEGYTTVKDISKTSKLSQSRVSVLVNELQYKEFLNIKRIRRKKIVEFYFSKHAENIRRLFSSNIPVEKILAGGKLDILFSIHKNFKNINEIREETCLEKETIRKYLRELSYLGVVEKKDKRYKLAYHPLLYEFLSDYSSYANKRIVREYDESAIILWEEGRRFIFKTENRLKIDRYIKPTAFTAMSKYKIDIISKYYYYYYSPCAGELRVEDIALHSIVVDKESSRNLIYAMLLLKKAGFDEEYLIKASSIYGAKTIAKNMIEYLRTGKTVERIYGRRFPNIKEFKEIASEYGVEV